MQNRRTYNVHLLFSFVVNTENVLVELKQNHYPDESTNHIHDTVHTLFIRILFSTVAILYNRQIISFSLTVDPYLVLVLLRFDICTARTV